MRKDIRIVVLAAILVTLFPLQLHAQDKLVKIHKKAWDFDRSTLEWYPWAKKEEQKKKGTMGAVAGWVEYDFDVPKSAWYELWQTGVPPGWTRDIFLDGKLIVRLHATSTKLDKIQKGKRRGWALIVLDAFPRPALGLYQ